MSYLNANIPVEYAQIRREYLYDLKKHHGEVEDCIIFGLSSIAGHAILFHRSEEHTSELQSRLHLVCRLLLEKKKKNQKNQKKSKSKSINTQIPTNLSNHTT